MHHHITLHDYKIGNDLPMVLIAGPCQMESRDLVMTVAEHLMTITSALKMPLIFKTSFDKANRSSLNGARGMGLKKALPIFAEIKEQFGCPVLTDVHLPEQCEELATVVDVLQIPAFLCRQTDLLLAAGRTGAIINVKKGQFLAPWNIGNIAAKIASTGNQRIMLTERGASFGYNRLINDMRALSIMAETGYPVIFDATHSVQEPGSLGDASGGQSEMVPLLARSAVAAGVAGVFIETHPNPQEAESDGPCMMPLMKMKELLKQLQQFDRLRKSLTTLL